MNDRRKMPYLQRYALTVAFLWTALIVYFLYLNTKQHKAENFKIAYAYAYVGQQKDVLYRRWSAMHGGVYVPVTKVTQPNPYLSHLWIFR